MIDILIDLATAAMSFGTITAAAMYPSGLVTVDGVLKDGKAFCITFRPAEESKGDAGDNP